MVPPYMTDTESKFSFFFWDLELGLWTGTRLVNMYNICKNIQKILLNIQCVPWQRASGIGLLQAHFRSSEVPKGFIGTPRVGANYI